MYDESSGRNQSTRGGGRFGYVAARNRRSPRLAGKSRFWKCRNPSGRFGKYSGQARSGHGGGRAEEHSRLFQVYECRSSSAGGCRGVRDTGKPSRRRSRRRRPAGGITHRWRPAGLLRTPPPVASVTAKPKARHANCHEVASRLARWSQHYRAALRTVERAHHQYRSEALKNV